MATRGPAGFTHDPDGEFHDGMPTYIWRRAPAHLKTRRQLSADGLRPGGQPVAGQIMRGAQIAYLYDIALAKPKFRLTPAKQAAVWTAARARQRCAGPCGRTDLGYIPRQAAPCWGACWDCIDNPTIPHNRQGATP
jgi:hypothetical protein